MTSINPNSRLTIQHPIKIDQGQDPEAPVKPNLQNMQDLYKIWNEAKIVYFPAAAFAKCIENRTAALETYVKENNLDSNCLKNLEIFFNDIKENMTGGGMGASQYLITRFQDYLENGFEKDNTALERTPVPTLPLDSGSPDGGKGLEWGKHPADTEIEHIKWIIEQNNTKSDNIFKDDENK